MPESYASLGCLGLRIKRRDGVEAIATSTHGFVRQIKAHGIVLRMADWLIRAKETLSRFCSPKTAGVMRGQVEIREASGNTPLGKDVYLAGSAQKVCNIGTCFP